MRVYLDMCSIQRPLDTRSQVRISIEAEAILGVLSLSESGQLHLIASDALIFEAERNPHPVRKRYAFEVLAKATVFVRTEPPLEERTRALVAAGLKTLDALHLASAEASQANFFCTSPLELVEEIAP